MIIDSSFFKFVMRIKCYSVYMDKVLGRCRAKAAHSAMAALNNLYQAMDSYEDEQN